MEMKVDTPQELEEHLDAVWLSDVERNELQTYIMERLNR